MNHKDQLVLIDSLGKIISFGEFGRNLFVRDELSRQGEMDHRDEIGIFVEKSACF